MRCDNAIEENVVTSATSTPLRRSESSDAASGFGKGWRDVSAMSPPRRDRACSRTLRWVLLANESIATSAATPSEMDDM